MLQAFKNEDSEESDAASGQVKVQLHFRAAGRYHANHLWLFLSRARVGPHCTFPCDLKEVSITDMFLSIVQVVCSDLQPHIPSDFGPDPVNFLPEITDTAVKSWALALHHLWPQLCRKVTQQPDLLRAYNILQPAFKNNVVAMLAWSFRTERGCYIAIPVPEKV